MLRSSLRLIIPRDTASTKLSHSASSTNKSSESTCIYFFYFLVLENNIFGSCASTDKNYECRASKPHACQTSYKSGSPQGPYFFMLWPSLVIRSHRWIYSTLSDRRTLHASSEPDWRMFFPGNAC